MLVLRVIRLAQRHRKVVTAVMAEIPAVVAVALLLLEVIVLETLVEMAGTVLLRLFQAHLSHILVVVVAVDIPTQVAQVVQEAVAMAVAV